MQTYAAYLEPSVIEKLSDIRHSEYLVLRLHEADSMICYPFLPPGMIDSGMDTRPLGSEAYRQFWIAMHEVDRLLERDTSQLARRL